VDRVTRDKDRHCDAYDQGYGDTVGVFPKLRSLLEKWKFEVKMSIDVSLKDPSIDTGKMTGKKRVILDTDPALGIKNRDVDDGLAILLLLASPEVQLEGITINFGNVKAALGVTCAKKTLQVAGVEVPVFEGAHSRHNLGEKTAAVDYLIKTVRDNPGQISLVTIAPLTNVATAMMLDQEFEHNLKELVVMGGTFRFPVFRFFGEFNFHCDGRASSRVMQSPVPKTLITMDLCTQAPFQDRHLAPFLESHTAVGRYLAEHISPWLKSNKRIFFRKKGFFPWDPIAAGYLLYDTMFDRVPMQFEVNEEGMRSGRLLKVRKLSSFNPQEGRTPINVPSKMDGERFLNLLVQRLLSL